MDNDRSAENRDIVYSLVAGDDVEALNLFGVDEKTAEVYVTRPDQIDSERQTAYNIKVNLEHDTLTIVTIMIKI